MIEVIPGRRSIEVSGHAKDKIVCAAVSSVTEMAGRYLESRGRAKVKRGKGYILIYDTRERCELTEALREFFESLQEQHPDEIKINYVHGDA